MPETGCSVSTRFVAEGHLERIAVALLDVVKKNDAVFHLIRCCMMENRKITRMLFTIYWKAERTSMLRQFRLSTNTLVE